MAKTAVGFFACKFITAIEYHAYARVGYCIFYISFLFINIVFLFLDTFQESKAIHVA